MWNMKVTIIPTVIGALGTVTKGLIQGLEDLEIRGRMKTTAFFRLARIQGNLNNAAVSTEGE